VHLGVASGELELKESTPTDIPTEKKMPAGRKVTLDKQGELQRKGVQNRLKG